MMRRSMFLFLAIISHAGCQHAQPAAVADTQTVVETKTSNSAQAVATANSNATPKQAEQAPTVTQTLTPSINPSPETKSTSRSVPETATTPPADSETTKSSDRDKPKPRPEPFVGKAADNFRLETEIFSTTNADADQQIHETLEKYRNKIAKTVQQIDVAKKLLKKAQISDKTVTIQAVTKQISDLQTQLKTDLDTPLNDKTLLQDEFAIGKIGRLAGPSFNIIQVLDRTVGVALVRSTYFANARIIMLHNIDASGLVDGGKLGTGIMHSYCVSRIRDYETVAGGTNSVFVLYSLRPENCFAKSQMDEIKNALAADFEFKFTDTEAAAMAQAREANAKVTQELAEVEAAKKSAAAKVAQEVEAKKTADAKAARAKSYLDSAKTLLRKDQRTGARKFLEKALAEDPDSETAKEAKKLLDEN